MDGSEQRVPASKTSGRGRGKPFVAGDSRINRRGVPKEAVALAKLLRDAAADVLLSPSPRCEAKTRLVSIVEALADKAERGDVKAAEILFDRVGGRPTQPQADTSERGPITFEWTFEPPPWAPKHILDEYQAKRREKFGEPPALLEAGQPQAVEVDAPVTQTSEPAPPIPSVIPAHVATREAFLRSPVPSAPQDERNGQPSAIKRLADSHDAALLGCNPNRSKGWF